MNMLANINKILFTCAVFLGLADQIIKPVPIKKHEKPTISSFNKKWLEEAKRNKFYLTIILDLSMPLQYQQLNVKD